MDDSGGLWAWFYGKLEAYEFSYPTTDCSGTPYLFLGTQTGKVGRMFQIQGATNRLGRVVGTTPVNMTANSSGVPGSCSVITGGSPARYVAGQDVGALPTEPPLPYTIR